MSDFTDAQLVAGMRSLKGEICTLSHQREMANALRERGYMRFNEWPSGHWSVTERGMNFLLSVSEGGE